MKFKNLAINTKYTAIALIFAACHSDQEKLAQLNAEFDRVETEIGKAYINNEATDSAKLNSRLKYLNKIIAQDNPRINELFERNWELSDSINNIKIQNIAKKYPLSKFLSRNVLKMIQNQLRHGHNYGTEISAQRIIAGRGTLQDLYNVSFDLYFDEAHAPFHIIDPMGTVRFGDKKRDALCKQFDDEKFAVQSAMLQNVNNQEYLENEKEIKRFDHFCDMRDKIYSEIESCFQSQINHRIDSLKNVREDIRRQRDALLRDMQMRNK